MQIQRLITSTDVQKLKQRARLIKKRDGIAHHEALDRVAAEAGFHHWHQVADSAKAFAPTERAYFFGTIIAMDVKDGMDFHDESGVFVEDDSAFVLCGPDMYYQMRVEEGGEVDPSDAAYKADLDEWMMDDAMDWMFFRLSEEVKVKDVADVLARVRQCCFWPPECIWHEGVFEDCLEETAFDAEGNLAGVRFTL